MFRVQDKKISISLIFYILIVQISHCSVINISNEENEVNSTSLEINSSNDISVFVTNDTDIEPTISENEVKSVEIDSLDNKIEHQLVDEIPTTVPEIIETTQATTITSQSHHVIEKSEEIIEEIIEKKPDDAEQKKREIKERAMIKLKKIFNLPETFSRNLTNSPEENPPEFMIDLYNTVTDSYGVTRAKNLPYDSQIVRSFMERNNSLNDYFFFNISGIIDDKIEPVLAAELHVNRQRISHEELHPSLYFTPFYILSLYQVLDMNRLEIPDLHRLIGVHYVPALGSGWEVFNIKQAVLEWIKGSRPNYGFLIVGTSLGGDRVPVRFSRRGETKESKQPILVLFNEDVQLKSKLKLIHQKVDLNPTPTTPSANANETIDNDEVDDVKTTIPTSSLENPQFHHALLYKDSIRHPNSIGRLRSRRSKNHTEMSPEEMGNDCGRRDLFVSFEAIGWSSWIISPKKINIFYCDGVCGFPLGQQNNPTNHAIVQSIINELNLAPGIKTPCCTPNKLLPISLLYYNDNDDVVLKQYVDMTIDSCGCH